MLLFFIYTEVIELNFHKRHRDAANLASPSQEHNSLFCEFALDRQARSVAKERQIGCFDFPIPGDGHILMIEKILDQRILVASSNHLTCLSNMLIANHSGRLPARAQS